MILKLVKTELRSEGLLILVAAAVSVFMWLSETAARDGQSATLATLIYGQLAFPILVVIIAVRKRVQKRERLLAQLPVTGVAIRVSSWLGYIAIILAACLISTVMLVLYPIRPNPGPFAAALPDTGWLNIVAVGALMIAAFLTVVALIRIFHLSFSMKRTVRYAVLVGWVIVIWLLRRQWMLFFDVNGPYRVDRIIQWDLLLPAALGLTTAMVVADILLDRLAENRLR